MADDFDGKTMLGLATMGEEPRTPPPWPKEIAAHAKRILRQMPAFRAALEHQQGQLRPLNIGGASLGELMRELVAMQAATLKRLDYLERQLQHIRGDRPAKD